MRRRRDRSDDVGCYPSPDEGYFLLSKYLRLRVGLLAPFPRVDRSIRTQAFPCICSMTSPQSSSRATCLRACTRTARPRRNTPRRLAASPEVHDEAPVPHPGHPATEHRVRFSREAREHDRLRDPGREFIQHRHRRLRRLVPGAQPRAPRGQHEVTPGVTQLLDTRRHHRRVARDDVRERENNAAARLNAPRTVPPPGPARGRSRPRTRPGARGR